MLKGTWFAGAIGCAAIGTLLAGPLAYAEPAAPTPETELRALKQIVIRQAEELEAQRQALEVQLRRLENLEKQVNAGARPVLRRAVLRVSPPQKDCVDRRCGILRTAEEKKAEEKKQEAPSPGKAGSPAEKGKVGAPPKKEKARREVAGVERVGGVLTPKGTLILEPSIQYSQSNINRFFFQGLEIVETVLVGQIEATDSDRDSLILRGAARYGITDRIEANVSIPYVLREDRVTSNIISTSESSVRELSAADLGDIEFGGRYQINRGLRGWPIFVANLRVKTTTGVGPFDVARDADGIETELPTGSGFWGIEPGITMIYPSDPAVFFAKVSYLSHLERGIDKTIGGSLIGDVDPGDVIGITFGMGIGLNERTSFSIGYDHSFIGETKTEITPAGEAKVTRTSEPLDVGALVLGFSHVVSDRVAVNLNFSAGITDDAPDIVMTLRVPVRFDNLFSLDNLFSKEKPASKAKPVPKEK